METSPGTPPASPTSVITCDLAGRIQTVNHGAEELFGWSREELVGKRRVSVFSPGLVVLEHVPRWLATAVKDGRFEGDTVFVRRDGRPIACHVEITPTWREGVHIGFCGRTVALPGVEPAAVAPPISFRTRLMRWLVILRLPFLSASALAAAGGAAVAAARGDEWGWGPAAAAVACTAVLHLGANVANDYFDWTSGTDAANTDYVTPFSGGSRSVELGLASPGLLAAVAAVLFGVAGLLGAVLAMGNPALWWVGLAGGLLGLLYTVPGVRLAARRGLGEIAVGIAFGPLATLATWMAATGESSGSGLAAAALAGVPLGLWTTGILWVNEIPDVAGDRAAGKLNLVATLGRRQASRGLPVLLGAGHAALVAGAAAGFVPAGALLGLVAVPLAVKASRAALAHAEDDGIAAACAATISHQGLATGAALAGMVVQAILS